MKIAETTISSDHWSGRVNALEFTDLRTGISSIVHQSLVFTKCSNILIDEFCSNRESRISPFTENLVCEKNIKDVGRQIGKNHFQEVKLKQV